MHTRHAAWAVLAVAAGTAAAIPASARPADRPSCPSSTDAAYTMAASALTGQSRTDLGLRFTAAPDCAAVTAVKHVQIKTYGEGGTLDGVVNLNDVAAQDGVAEAALARVDRGRRVEVDALVQ